MKRFVTIGMLVTVATLFGEVSFSALNIGGAEYVTGVTHPEFRAATNALWQAKQDKRIIHYCVPSGGSSRAFVETAAEMREIIKKTGEPAFCQVDNAYLLSMYSASVSPSGNEFLANFRAPCDMSRDYILSLSITNNPSGVAYISAITFGLTNRMPLKTVNGNSLIGSGNIVIEGGGGSNPDKITNLTSVITAEGKIITRPNASSVTWTTNTLLSTASHAVILKEDYDNSAYTVFDVAQHCDVRPTLSDGAYGAAFGYYSLANGNYSFAAGYKATANSDRSFVWSGTSSSTGYDGFGDGTFSINPTGGLSGFYVGDNNMNSILGGYVPTTRTVAGKQLNANVSLGTLTLGSQTYDGSANVTLDMSGYVPTSRTVNGKALTDNISLTKDDVGVDDTKLWSGNHLQYVNGNCEIYESVVLDYIYTNGVSMIEALVPSYMTFAHTQSNVWTAIKDGNRYTMTVTPDEWTAGVTNFVLLKNGERPCPQNERMKYDGDDTEIIFAQGGVILYKSETGREFRKKTELTTSNTVENIVAASLIKATNSMLRPSYIRVVNGVNESIIHADMRYESSILVTNGIFREKTYSSSLGRYVTNELTWIEAYSGWGHPFTIPPIVKISKEGDGYKYFTLNGHLGGEPVSFSGEWQEMPYYYVGKLPYQCMGTNWLQYVWRTNVTVQTIATIENVQKMTNDTLSAAISDANNKYVKKSGTSNIENNFKLSNGSTDVLYKNGSAWTFYGNAGTAGSIVSTYGSVTITSDRKIRFWKGNSALPENGSLLTPDGSVVATSNIVVSVVDDRANLAITTAVDNAMTEMLGSNWKTTYGGGLAGLVAAIVAALLLLKRGKFDSSEIAPDWSSSTTYALGENVTYRGKFYASKSASNLNHVPTDTTWWNVCSLFTSANTSLVAVCREYGGTQIKQDENGNFYYEVEVED